MFFDKLKQFGIVNDLFKNKFEKHPFTYGYNGEDFPMYDSTLTCKEDVGSNQTLDYIFEIIPNLNSIMFRFDTKELKCNSKINLSESKEDSLDSQENLKQCELLIDYESVKVEEFLVSNKPYQQLSDHFGLSVEVRLNSYADV